MLRRLREIKWDWILGRSRSRRMRRKLLRRRRLCGTGRWVCSKCLRLRKGRWKWRKRLRRRRRQVRYRLWGGGIRGGGGTNRGGGARFRIFSRGGGGRSDFFGDGR